VKYIYCLAKVAKSKEQRAKSIELRTLCPLPYALCAMFDAFPLGLGGVEVYGISFGEIGAMISDVDSDQPVCSVQSVLAHQKVVDAALRLSKSVIPCRFGTLFPDDENILTFLKEHYELLDAQLTRLEGKVEVGVQVILNRRAGVGTRGQWDEETRGQEGPGISYLLRRKEQFDGVKELDEEMERFSRELNWAMSPLWSDVKMEKTTQGKKLLLSLYYLVDKHKLPCFKLAYRKFKRENPSLRLMYTGPWAPYNFADIDLKVVSR